MTAGPSDLTPRKPADAVALHVQVYRYFFYGWLFRDADTGSAMERSVALRHNCEQAKWLPTYLLRWAVVGVVLVGLESLSERFTGNSPLSTVLTLMLIFVAMFHMITVICWAFLNASRQSR